MRQTLKKLKCPACGHVHPLMDMINSATCLNCHNAFVEPVENGYVIIETEPFEIIEISKD